MVARHRTRHAVGLACLVGLAGCAPAWAQSPARAWVLDSGWNAVVAIEPSTGRLLATLAVKSRPEGLLRSPDGAHLAVIERGPGDDKKQRGYQAKGRSAVTIVDATALSIVGRVELGHGADVSRAFFGVDRVAFFCPGYEAKNATESQPRELVIVSLKDARELGRVTLEYGAVPVELARDGRTLVVVQGLPRGAKPPFTRSRLFFVDLVEPDLASSLEAGGWTSLSSDGRSLYLLDRGKPDADARKNRNGTLQVVSLERRALVASHDAGRDPRGLVANGEDASVLVVSDGPPGRLDSELRIVCGESLFRSAGVAPAARLLVRRQDRVFVVGRGAVTLADPATAAVVATLPLTRGAERLVFDDEVPSELMVSPDGRRAFVLYQPGERVAVLDLEEAKLLGVAKTGRGGRKLLRGLGQVAGVAALLPTPVGDMASVAEIAALAAAQPGPIRPGHGRLAVSADGRLAFALGARTADVTAVDAATATASATVAAAGYRLLSLGGGATLVAMGIDRLHLLQTTPLRRAAELELPGLRDVVASPDGGHAVALAKRQLLCLNGSTGAVVATLTSFVEPTVAIFDAGAPAR